MPRMEQSVKRVVGKQPGACRHARLYLRLADRYSVDMSTRRKSRPIPAGAPGHPRDGGPKEQPGPSRAGRGAGPSARTRDGRPKDRTKGSRGHVAFIYEDDWIIAVDKPAGLPVIAPEGSRATSLYDIVTERIRRRNPKGRAAVVHRLDRESSGVLVFAVSGKVKTSLMSAWDRLARERRYEAIVEGELEEDEGRIESWIAPSGTSKMRVARPGEQGALKAITDYRVLARGRGYSRLELRLETGRKHQIRAQLAAEGYPIAGDQRYGARTDPAGRVCLHAVLLVLEHPVTHEVLRFESPPPGEFAAVCGAPGKPAGSVSGPDAFPSASRHGGESGGRPLPRGPRGAGPSPRTSAPRGRRKGQPGPS